MPHAQRLRARDLPASNGPWRPRSCAAGGQWEALGLELLHADGVAEAHVVTVEGEAEGVEDGGDGGGSGPLEALARVGAFCAPSHSRYGPCVETLYVV